MVLTHEYDALATIIKDAAYSDALLLDIAWGLVHLARKATFLCSGETEKQCLALAELQLSLRSAQHAVNNAEVAFLP